MLSCIFLGSLSLPQAPDSPQPPKTLSKGLGGEALGRGEPLLGGSEEEEGAGAVPTARPGGGTSAPRLREQELGTPRPRWAGGCCRRGVSLRLVPGGGDYSWPGFAGGGLPALAPILLREDEEGKGAGRWWHRYFWAPRDPSPCCVHSAHQANPAGKQHLGFPPLGPGGCKFPQN